MKFTLSWLKTHLETNASLDDITYALTDLGMEVEDVANPLDRLADFTIGYVTHAEKHPEADRLQVCKVDTGEGELQIICGAPNARQGIHVVVAKPGVYVPGIDTTIGVGKIRGVESFGMMCSEREMELSDEHDGIIELSGEPVIGGKYTDYLAENDPSLVDPVIDIAITPNRPDALGIRGIARDLAARGLGALKPQEAVEIEAKFKSDISVSIDADVIQRDCPLFCGRLIKGVKNGPSPKWLQDQLKAIGLRPISALVDITNFLTMDQARPLHVFDADAVKGDLRVHYLGEDTAIEALDDKTYTLRTGMMGISDDTGVESIAGIMGGLHTACTEDTQNVFLESAYWDPIKVAKTGRALKINSDARYRFERGVDPEFTPVGLDQATTMVIELCGGEASEMVVAGAVPDTSRQYLLDTDRVQSLVGMEITAEAQRKTLLDLGFKLDGDMATPPPWRPDVLGEADLVEEIARVASLTKLVGKPLPRIHTGVPKPILTPLQKREGIARRTAASLGYNECVTYSFVDKSSAALFGGGSNATMLENPISSEMSHMRPSLLVGLLQAASRNQARGFSDLALFEVGPEFQGGEPQEQRVAAAGILVGSTGSKDVHSAQRNVDVFDVKADAEAILFAIGAPSKVQINRGANTWWHPGRNGSICLGPKKVMAEFGEIHPKVLAAMDVKGPAVGFTVYLAEPPQPRSTTPTRASLNASDFQPVERDYAFVVDAKVEALTLVNAARGADKELIASAYVFDEFGGARAVEQMGEGKKSLAISVRLQPIDRTLTEKDIEAVSAKIIDKVAKATGGTLRG
jgi:phenylalanyl-tRNA synthetase beta chain